MDAKRIIVIGGPTACGKSKVAVDLALKIDGEIISADSMQVYKGMDIGTAKPDAGEMKGVRHYLIDEVYPCEEFSVAEFQKRASRAVETVLEAGKVPIVAGGTGFYINALVKGTEFVSQSDGRVIVPPPAGRPEELRERLRQVDPAAAEAIHPNNTRRAARALEYFLLTGERISEHNARERERAPVYDASVFILSAGRPALYRRIEQRADRMIALGLLEEVRGLLDSGCGEGLTSMAGLGYKEMVRHLKHNMPMSAALELLKRNTRRFAKRQITWFKNQSPAHPPGKELWFDIDDYGNYSIIADRIAEIFLSQKSF
ncbi:MAG: tRNA (adenosine(37)-N6)-dimethylallyltransferase MiaA [Clostridiales bacterium]|jgi:tRNA dimethylallyltransferase|nr:tRNA (adenosine(37)-N6)-dimethylallyltransferase MiaA [Clostridiales bacterium]